MRPFYAALFAFLALTPLTSMASGSYTLVELPGVIDSGLAEANSLSTFGVAGDNYVGNWNQGTGVWQPAIWQNGLSSLLHLPLGYQGRIFGLNATGVAVGPVWHDSLSDVQPGIWQNGQFQMLPTGDLPGGTPYSVNNQGRVVGSIHDDWNSISKAALWTNDQLTLLGNFSGVQSSARSINNSGDALVVVYATQPETWLWSNGNLTPISSSDGSGVSGTKVNDLGHITGGTTSLSHDSGGAFLWINGSLSLLPNLDNYASSIALSLNNLDQTVGTGTSPTGETHALFWQNGQVFDLNALIPSDSGWTLYSATDIADDGTIVGYGLYNGQVSAYQLTPTGSASSSLATPEPTTFLLLLLTSPLLLRRRVPNRITAAWSK